MHDDVEQDDGWQFAELHEAINGLYAVRNGEPWPADLKEIVGELARAIALHAKFGGECDCSGQGCSVSISCTDPDDYAYPPFVEWRWALYMYDHFPNETTDPDNGSEEDFQQPNESNLDFAIRCINALRESDGIFSSYDEDSTTMLQLASLKLEDKSIWFWIMSHPQRAGYYFEVYPKAWSNENAAKAGLKDIGFQFVEELTEEDLPRLGFPAK